VTAAAEQLLRQALGGGTENALNAESLLGELAGDDPTLALMTKMLLESSAAAEPEPEPQADEPDLGELEELRERNEALAAALGACFACWGTDIFCMHCGGEGRPGTAQPDHRLFTQLVAPAAARVGGRASAIPTEGGRNE
jgi:hypothetical protein